MPDHSFEEKWGAIMAGDGFTQIPNALITYAGALNIKSNEFFLLAALIKHAWTIESSFPSHATLCKYMGMKESQIKRIIRQLEGKGIIERNKRGPRQSNLYTFNGLKTILEQSLVTEVDVLQKRLDRKRAKLGGRVTNMDS